MSAQDWTDDEQQRLEEALAQPGQSSDAKEKWRAVAQAVGTRKASECAARFKLCREMAKAKLSADTDNSEEVKRKAEEVERKAEEADEAKRRAEEKRQAEQKAEAERAAAKLKAEEELAAKQQADEEALAAKEKAEEARQLAQENEAKMKSEDEDVRKKAERDAARQRAKDEETSKQQARAEEQARAKAAKEVASVVEEAAPAVEAEGSADEAGEEDDSKDAAPAPVLSAAEQRAADIRRDVEANREKLRKRQEEEERSKAKKKAAEDATRVATARAPPGVARAPPGTGASQTGKGKGKEDSAKGKGDDGKGSGKGVVATGKGKESVGKGKDDGGKGKNGKPAADDKPVISMDSMPALPGSAGKSEASPFVGATAASNWGKASTWGGTAKKAAAPKPKSAFPDLSPGAMPALQSSSATKREAAPTVGAGWGKGSTAAPKPSVAKSPAGGPPQRDQQRAYAPPVVEEAVPDSWDSD